MDKVYMSAPFAKVIKTEENGREIFGWATLERVDKSGEIADFEGTVKAFEKWSNETEQRTGGKSKGNVRLMHQPIAVGKTISWKPSETTIQDEEGNSKTVKGIWVGAYIPPTKPDVIRDIDEGILSAFSIGGSYQKRWWDEGAQAFRFIPELSEYSLVDNPCVEGASVEQVIQKADVPWAQKEGETMDEEVSKNSTPKGGENTIMKGENNAMELEQLTKAAEQAGLTIEQIQAFFKALTPVDQPPAPESVTTIDGDGDEDKNKEFPNPNEHASNQGAVESDVKAAEEESGVAEKGADTEIEKADIVSDDDQPNQGTDGKEEDDVEEKCDKCGKVMSDCKCSKADKSAPAPLAKEGKSISKKNAAHMQHAVNHIDAALKSADYTADDHLVIENQLAGQGLTGEEAPLVAEKVFQTAFTKSIGNVVEGELAKALTSFTKSVDDLKTMVKGLASKDELTKAVSELEAVKALVKEIHDTPQAGGPLLNGGNPAIFAKNFNQMDIAQVEGQALEKFVQEVKDPVLKDRLGQELAARKMKDVFNR